MIHLWNGILVGLALSILVGPILFSLIQTSIEQGARAGLWVALGIWVSDILFIGSIMFSVAHITQVIESPFFKPLLGTLGGFVLIGIGVSMFISQPITTMKGDAFQIFSSKWRLGLEGFLINTVNPFTIIFWTSVITSWAMEESLFSTNSYLFLGSILSTIMFTDSLKIFLAKKIRTHLKPIHILKMRKISGLALFIFGVAMIVRVTLF